MDDRRSTIGARRVVAFDVEEQPQQEDSAAASSSSADAEAVLKRVSIVDDQGDQGDHGSSEEHGNGEFEEEDYDPYYGLGVRDRPDLPVLLVFNLMESRRFDKFSSPLREKLFNIAALVGGTLLVAMLLFCLALLGFQLRERPQLPVVNVKSVAYGVSRLYEVSADAIRRQQEEGKGNYYTYKLNYVCEVMMNVTNPNRHVDIHHRYIEVVTFYQGTPLAVDRIDNIPHPRGSVIRPVFRAFAVSLPLQLKVGYTLKQELLDERLQWTGPTRMVVEIHFQSQISLLHGIKGLPFAWRCRCAIDYTGAFKCHCLDAKWRPHHHLKHYRDATWPTDYTEITNPMISNPADYYDPNINYYAQMYNVGSYNYNYDFFNYSY